MVVFTGLFGDEPGERTYLTMDEDGSHKLCHGRPPVKRLVGGIPFEELPEPCRELVLEGYRRLWEL